MVYKLIYLPLASRDILEIEARLYELSPATSDRITDEIGNLTETLMKFPFMYQEFEYDIFYRSMPLPYNYRLFYHIDEAAKTIEIHRILHGMMDFKTHLPQRQGRIRK